MANPPNAHDAYVASHANLTALQTAANNAFISDAATQIATSEALGKYFIVLKTTENCDIVALQTYFRSLNYNVFYLDLPNPNLNPFNPAELFGYFYFDYWFQRGVPFGVHNPQRIRISWNPPYIPIYPYP